MTAWFAPPGLHNLLWVLAFTVLGAGLMGALGLIAGLWAEKFDQMAAFQNFIIMPMTFLSGVFYSIHSLPDFWQKVSHLNPFFYMIDGFRYGFFGVSDVSPWLSLAIVGTWLASHAPVPGPRTEASAVPTVERTETAAVEIQREAARRRLAAV